MVEPDASDLHLIDAAAVDVDDVAMRRGADGAALVAMRAARPILDRLERCDRARIEAVVVSDPDPDASRVADVARRMAGGLSLAPGLRLPVAGLNAGGLFAALHVAHAAMARSGAAKALVVSFGSDPTDAGVSAFLLARGGGAGCRPLPPMRVTSQVEEGAALMSLLGRAGVARRTVRRAASPGLGWVDAARVLREVGMAHVLKPSVHAGLSRATSAEAVLVDAAASTPAETTLLWSRSPEGYLAACLLEPVGMAG